MEKNEGEVSEMMKLRLAMSKTSIKKYEAMERSVCPDGRVHGLLQFYGANRTGRWAGRLVQIHNLPQNHMEDLELARSLVKEGRYDLIELLYDSTPEVLSELIRTRICGKGRVPLHCQRFLCHRSEGNGLPCRGGMGHGGIPGSRKNL